MYSADDAKPWCRVRLILQLIDERARLRLFFYANVLLYVEALYPDVFQLLDALLYKRIVLKGHRKLERAPFPLAGAAIVKVLSILITHERIRATSRNERCRRVLTLIEVVIEECKVSCIQHLYHADALRIIRKRCVVLFD
jgi:hypothetical protein